MFILYILAGLISLILLAMVIFGIYYIVAHIQVELIYKVLDELWDSCSLIYYYMDDSSKKIFEKRLKCELDIELEPIDYELEQDDANHTKLRKLLISVPKLYEKYDKKFQKSCIMARNIVYGSDIEVREVTNVINSILGVWR